jgi:hypothetical protein
MESQDLVETVSTELRNNRISEIDKIKSRDCSSEEFSGVSMTITGNHVPIDVIIEVVKGINDWRIKNIGMHGDILKDESENEYERGVVIFFAYIGHIIEDDVFV